jgi:O-antigen/teichoic acid export membrane protein
MTRWHIALARDTALYGFTSVALAAAGLLTIPLYTHALTPRQFGVLEILNRIADVFTLIVFLGLRQAFVRFYFEQDSDGYRRRVTATYLAFISISMGAAIAIACLAAFGTNAAGRLGLDWEVLGLALAWIVSDVLAQVYLGLLQMDRRALAFLIVSVAKMLAFLTAAAIGLYVFHLGVRGVFLGNFIATAAVGLPGIIGILSWSGLAIDRAILLSMIRFGAPYVPAAALMYVIGNSDRYFVGKISDFHALGIYALGAKIGMMGTLLLMDAFMRVWGPFIFDAAKREEGPSQIAAAFKVFAAGTAWAAVAVSVLAPLAVRLLAGRDFAEAYVLVPPLALASVFYALHVVSDAGILIQKKTEYKPLIFGAGALVAVVAGYAGTTAFGPMGTAWAVVLTNASLFLITFVISSKLYPMPTSLRQIAAIVGAAVACTAGFYLTGAQRLPPISEVAAAVIPIALFPLLLLLAQVFSAEERTQARELGSAIIGRLLARGR